MKKIAFCLLISLFAGTAVFAQSSDKLTQIIKSERITYEQASYLPALYANLTDDEQSSSATFEALKSAGYFSSKVQPDSEITLAQISRIYMKSLNLKGGLFYNITSGSARYAFKELKANGILPTEADPSMTVSGREAIDIFNSCLELTGGN